MLSKIAALVEGRLVGEDRDVAGVTRDSRRVGAGDLFAALPGERRNGADYASVAEAAGAAGILSERQLQVSIPQILVADARRAMALAAHAVHGQPTATRLEVVGITGTNGKTTVSYLVDAVLRHAAIPTTLLGTVATRIGGVSEKTYFTTPEADDLAVLFRRARDAGDEAVVMEVSSHGLAMDRVLGTRFSVAAFTNLTQDHLDYHGTMEAYADAKARLFLEHRPGTSVVNVDDAFGAELATRIESAVLRTSARDESAEIFAHAADFGADGITARVRTPAGEGVLRSPLVGAHNLENLLTTIGVATALGVSLETTMEALATSGGAPGRLERVEDPRGVSVLVDYAHTPDALRRALAALRPVTSGRLVVVFGCGGDRDTAKRSQMGAAAAVGADICVVTSDNPRTENPDAIVDMIEPALASEMPRTDDLSQSRGYARIVDRREAIGAALAAAHAGDTVLIAGKGHEDYQIVGEERRPFDDRVVAREAIQALAGKGGL